VHLRGFHLAPFLHQLAAALELNVWVESVKAIESATIPVIKLLCDPSKLRKDFAAAAGKAAADWGGAGGRVSATGGLVPVDISFDDGAHAGIASSKYVKGIMLKYPEAYPLTVVLKELLAQRGLNEPFSGGLSSYSLVLLVITILQQAGIGPTAFEVRFWVAALLLLHWCKTLHRLLTFLFVMTDIGRVRVGGLVC
jgi:DNA polymerase sigma